jgi:hypothetical protein
MDWIEQWIGISPDNGDGSLEVLLVLVCVSVIPLLAISVNPRWRLVGRYLTDPAKRAAARQIR